MLGILTFKTDRECDLARLAVEVMDEQHPVIAPVVAHDQHAGIATRDHLEVAPPHLRDLLAHAYDPLCPIQEGIRMAALDGCIDMLKAVGSARDHRDMRLVALREAAVRLVRPLHRRASAITLR